MSWNRLANRPGPARPAGERTGSAAPCAADLDVPTYLRRGLSIPGMTKPSRRTQGERGPR